MNQKTFKFPFWALLALPFSLQAYPFVDIETSEGTITVELKPKSAPISVANFLRYVDSGFYDQTIFHRVINDFMVQGGGFDTDFKKKKTSDPITLESNNGLKNNRGTLAMARTSSPDSATAQFFINSIDNDFLNFSPKTSGYAVFGEVTTGIEIIDRIGAVKTTNDRPDKAIIIKTIRRKEGQLKFTGMKTSYSTGDKLQIFIEDFFIKREKALDLWIGIQLPNGNFIYLTHQNDNPFSTTPMVFKANVSPDETTQTVLNFTIPKGLAGNYTFYAIFNQPNKDINDLFHSLRSNIAQTQITLTD
ncbi:MAG: peptidylprolyl isomerase [Methylococcales bacterium]|nr:peptidylprolyl isomerase [Methylococcales bacterium]MCK5924710.1 peptidylprolyl isomerase [Methylococcales bacterium]